MKTKFFNLALAAVLAIAITGCGKKEDTNEQPVANSNAKKVIDTSTAGSVTGSVTLDGKPVPLKPINMSAEPYCQKTRPNPVVPPEVVVNDKDDVANVVVFVKNGLSPDYDIDTPKQPVTLNQQGFIYNPHIIALITDKTVEDKNDDQTT